MTPLGHARGAVQPCSPECCEPLATRCHAPCFKRDCSRELRCPPGTGRCRHAGAGARPWASSKAGAPAARCQLCCLLPATAPPAWTSTAVMTPPYSAHAAGKLQHPGHPAAASNCCMASPSTAFGTVLFFALCCSFSSACTRRWVGGAEQLARPRRACSRHPRRQTQHARRPWCGRRAAAASGSGSRQHPVGSSTAGGPAGLQRAPRTPARRRALPDTCPHPPTPAGGCRQQGAGGVRWLAARQQHTRSRALRTAAATPPPALVASLDLHGLRVVDLQRGGGGGQPTWRAGRRPAAAGAGVAPRHHHTSFHRGQRRRQHTHTLPPHPRVQEIGRARRHTIGAAGEWSTPGCLAAKAAPTAPHAQRRAPPGHAPSTPCQTALRCACCLWLRLHRPPPHTPRTRSLCACRWRGPAGC